MFNLIQNVLYCADANNIKHTFRKCNDNNDNHCYQSEIQAYTPKYALYINGGPKTTHFFWIKKNNETNLASDILLKMLNINIRHTLVTISMKKNNVSFGG